MFSSLDGDGMVNHEKVKDLQYLYWIQIYQLKFKLRFFFIQRAIAC